MAGFQFKELPMTDPTFAGVDPNTHIVLKTKDGHAYSVSRDISKQSQLIDTLLKDQVAGTLAPLDVEIDNETIKYVLAFVEKYHGNPMPEISKPLYRDLKDQLDDWQKGFLYTNLVKNGVEADHDLCKRVMEAGHYLQIDALRALTTACFGNMMRDKTTEQIRELFHIVNDYTPEEEEYLKKQNYWCEDEKEKDKK